MSIVVLNGVEYDFEAKTYRTILCASPSFVEDGCKQGECSMDCINCWKSQKQYSAWRPIEEASKDKLWR